MAAIEERINSKGEKTYRAKTRMRDFSIQAATSNRKTDAKHWVQNTESAIREGRYFSYSASKQKLMSDLIDRYIEEIIPLKPQSGAKQEKQLEVWKSQIGHLRIEEATTSVIYSIRSTLK